jgi:hypothetical protein
VSVAALVAALSVRPGGSEPDETDHELAVATVKVLLYATLTRIGLLSFAGAMPVTVSV